MARKLSNLRPSEVSLVPRGANEQEFLIVKGDDGMSALLKAVKDAGLSGKLAPKVTRALEQVQKETTERGQEALRAALEILMSVKEELPAELLRALMAEAGLGNPEPVEQEDPKEEEEAPIQKEDGSWDFSKVPAAAVRVWKEKIASDARLAKIEKQLADERDVRITKEFIEKAAEFKHLGVKTEDLGLVLKELSEKAPGAAALMEPILKSLDQKIAAGGIYSEIGTSRSGSTGAPVARNDSFNAPTEAEGKINQIAKGLVEKDGTGKVTQLQAIAKAWRDNPTLYREHRNEIDARKRNR